MKVIFEQKRKLKSYDVNIKNLHKLLSVVIPVYGKEPSETYNNISKIIRMDKRIEFIIVYKNSKKLNYDKLLTLNKFSNVHIYKLGPNVKRTSKVLYGIDMANNEFIMQMDPHHSLNSEELDSLLFELLFKSKQSNIFYMTPIERDIDNKKNILNVVRRTTAGRYIVTKSSLTGISQKVDFDVIFQDDWVMGIYSLSNYIDTTPVLLESNAYIKRYGTNISNTVNNLKIATNRKMITDSSKILNYFYKILIEKGNKVSEFSTQFALLLQDNFVRWKIVNNIIDANSYNSETLANWLTDLFGREIGKREIKFLREISKGTSQLSKLFGK